MSRKTGEVLSSAARSSPATMDGERRALIEGALLALLRADALESSSRTQRAILALRRDLEGEQLRGAGRPTPGPVQTAILIRIMDDGPLTEVEIRRAIDHALQRPRHVVQAMSGLHARGLVEAVTRPGLAALWRLTDAGQEFVEAFERATGKR